MNKQFNYFSTVYFMKNPDKEWMILLGVKMIFNFF